MPAVWRLSWPIILSNITVPLLGLVDTTVMGHLDDTRYLAAVTLGATLFSFLLWSFGFLRMGTTGLTSQAFGRDDHQAIRTLLGQSLIIALSIGVALVIFASPLIEAGIWLLKGDPHTQLLASSYAHIRILSAPAVLANYAIIGWFLGQQNSRVTLALMMLTNSVNIIFDLIFVVGLSMTSDGVAWGSVIADYTALIAGLFMLTQRLGKLEGHFLLEPLRRLSAYTELFRVNRHLFVRTLCLLFAMAFFTSQGAQLGNDVLAANAVLMQFVMLVSYGLDGFAHAAEALTGRAAGRRDWTLFAASVRACAIFSIIMACAASLFFAFGGDWLVALLTDIPEIRAIAARYLDWLTIMPLIAVWSYLLDGVFIGATATKTMRNTLLLAVACYLPTWYFTQSLGNHGLWLAFTVFTCVRSLSLGLAYRYRRRHVWCTEQTAHTS
ncbi:MATE family efflux transporter [Phytohalomonas tamaricis]|uniref:MATE family efflux transporter n=1 Tax=Phytohalomonas tamaricis TaxID=2081032 RepID=UPI000D0B82C0|nr:MATE family efflux transporter [Phytohalomonas tamaricis]